MRLFAGFLLMLTVFVAEIPAADKVPSTVPEYIETMARAVVEKNDPMRNRMFIRLRIEGANAVPSLIAALKDTREGVPEYVAFTLGWIADKRAIEPLTAMLAPGNSTRNRAILKALGNMKALEALPKMRPFLKDSDVAVRRDAVYSLGLLRDKSAVADVKSVLEDPDEVVRFLANEALERIETGW